MTATDAPPTDAFACKFRQWYGCFDADRDFLVTRNDFALAADRWTSAFQLPGDHQTAVDFRDTLRDVWDKVISPNGEHNDTGATPHDVIEGWRTALTTPNHPGPMLAFRTGELACQLMDRDHDGRISEAEYTHGMRLGFLVPDETSIDVFRYADQDHDGFITTEDFIRVSTEFITGDDLDSPASWMVGRAR